MEKLYGDLIEETITKSYSYPDIKNHNTFNSKEFKKTKHFKSLVKGLFEILDKHDQISPAKIKSLESHGIINLIGYTLDEFQALIKNNTSSSNVIQEYEKLTQMFLHLIYICKLQYGVTITLNKARNINYIYLTLYNSHLLKPSPARRGNKNLGKLDNYNHKKDPEIYLKAESEFFRLTTAVFLYNFFPLTMGDISKISSSRPFMSSAVNKPHRPKKENPFEPKHKPKPKA
jgi:hypothetical protein